MACKNNSNRECGGFEVNDYVNLECLPTQPYLDADVLLGLDENNNIGVFEKPDFGEVVEEHIRDVVEEVIDEELEDAVNNIIDPQIDTINEWISDLQNNKVSKSGDTMTGELILPVTAPTSDYSAATKYYTDTKVDLTGDNMTGPLTLYGDATEPLNAVTLRQVQQLIEEGKSDALTFKGYISPTQPTTDLREGNLWYQNTISSTGKPDTNFPWLVRTYTNGAWSTTTTSYTPNALDLWSDLTNEKGWYYFGNDWNQLDFSGSEFDPNYFTVTNGQVTLKDLSIGNNKIADNANINIGKINLAGNNSRLSLLNTPLNGSFLMYQSSGNTLIWQTPLTQSDIDNGDAMYSKTVSGNLLRNNLSKKVDKLYGGQVVYAENEYGDEVGIIYSEFNDPKTIVLRNNEGNLPVNDEVYGNNAIGAIQVDNKISEAISSISFPPPLIYRVNEMFNFPSEAEFVAELHKGENEDDPQMLILRAYDNTNITAPLIITPEFGFGAKEDSLVTMWQTVENPDGSFTTEPVVIKIIAETSSSKCQIIIPETVNKINLFYFVGQKVGASYWVDVNNVYHSFDRSNTPINNFSNSRTTTSVTINNVTVNKSQVLEISFGDSYLETTSILSWFISGYSSLRNIILDGLTNATTVQIGFLPHNPNLVVDFTPLNKLTHIGTEFARGSTSITDFSSLNLSLVNTIGNYSFGETGIIKFAPQAIGINQIETSICWICSELKTVDFRGIPNLNRFGDSNFFGCRKLDTIYIGSINFNNVTITSSTNNTSFGQSVNNGIIYADNLTLGNTFKSKFSNLSNWTVQITP